jgi:hypothetical protein
MSRKIPRAALAALLTLAAGAPLTACSDDGARPAYQADYAGSEARAWVGTYGKAADGEVTADFLDEGSVRQEVVLHFGGPRRTQELTVRIGDDGTWGVVLDAPDPKPAER